MQFELPSHIGRDRRSRSDVSLFFVRGRPRVERLMDSEEVMEVLSHGFWEVLRMPRFDTLKALIGYSDHAPEKCSRSKDRPRYTTEWVVCT